MLPQTNHFFPGLVYLEFIYELRHERIHFSLGEKKAQMSCAVISGFVFTTGIVQFLFLLNPKLQASKLNHDTILKVQNTPMKILVEKFW